MIFVLVAVASAASPEKLESWQTRAQAAVDAGDLPTALKFVDKVLAKDPDHVPARYLSAQVWLAVASIDPQFADAALKNALEDYRIVARLDPGGVRGGVAEGAIRGLTQGPKLALPEAECPPAAHEAVGRAEAAFGRRDAVAAKEAYAEAVALCPANATWLVWYGDADLMTGDTAAALGKYQQAVAIEPCHWMAHRFLADVTLGAGDLVGAHGHVMDALSCNPDYDEGRGTLAEIVKPAPLAWPDAPPREGRAQAAHPWPVIAAATRQGPVSLESERLAIEAGLEELPPTGADPLLALLAEASAAGQLDAAIFGLLLDDALYGSFEVWRATHRDELRSWLAARHPLPTRP